MCNFVCIVKFCEIRKLSKKILYKYIEKKKRNLNHIFYL